MGNTFYFEWEVKLMEAIQAALGSFGAKVASFISNFGEELILIVILGFMYWCWDKRTGKGIGLNIIMGVTYNPILKNIALRRRPYMDNPGIQCYKAVDSSADIMDIKAQGYSFPSGHSTNSTIAYGSLAYYFKNKPLRVIGVVLPLLVGISRVCVGVHYPTDVICGWALGCVIIFLMPWLQKKVPNKLVLYPVVFVISCVGCFYCKTNDYYTGLGMMAGFFTGDIFEEKVVKFNTTRVWWRCVLRVLLGGAIYLALNTLLKMPFSKEMLEAENALGYAIRTVRYAIVMFVEVGVYPLAFRILDKKKA
ncbi:MAG: phosphatase PAP2 family protein [Firmicutes bacterium]|nr:phosphatase PAP2 family protein [Bacillota bacterium]